MNRTTIAGKASVSLLCETFKLSRAAYYVGSPEPGQSAEKRGYRKPGQRNRVR
jgi:hypothetical protein